MIITLTTDFGLKDPYVGAMKGVILSLAPEVQLVDITHDIPSYDVSEAAIVIHDACRYFPSGTIHVVVVDPGVGSARRPIAFAAVNVSPPSGPSSDFLPLGESLSGQMFIAPDNGVLSLVAESGVARHITNTSLFHHPVSPTFHGRDIFAPVAAHLAAGQSIETVGPIVNDLVRHFLSGTAVVLRVDKFGNVVTNLRREQIGGGFTIRSGGIEVRRLIPCYSDALPGEIFAIEGSSGLIELSLNQGSAADRLNLRRGSEFEVETGTLNH